MNQQLGIDLYHYHIWVYGAKQTWSKVPLSHFYGPCPVAANGYTPHEEELLSPASVAAFVFVAFDCHLPTMLFSLCHLYVTGPKRFQNKTTHTVVIKKVGCEASCY